MSTEPYRWHYDYTRILWDAGFCFNNHKSLKTFDRNGIDIERIINDRDIRTVDYHIQSILEYSLDSEEARILDPNFVKLFRLSQLAVEYLNYCKKYLDATTDTLKKELQKTNEENTDLKNDLVSYELEISKLKKKVKDLKSTLHIHQKYQPPLSYPSTSATYRCNECRKGFISAEYLKKHFLKRHPHSSELEQLEAKLDNIEIDTESNSSIHPQYKAETDKLQMEIKELKEKLNNTERLFQNKNETPVEENKKENESKPQSEEYYKYIEELHHQFELLKTQIESEMQLLKSQKVEKDKYEELMEKFFHKLNERKEQEESKIDDNKPSTSKVDSPVQTDEIIIETEKQKVKQNKNEEITTVDEETETSPQKSNLTKTVNTSISVPSQEPVNVEKIKKEVEKELEIKSKQNIERLGKQISENITSTFDVLQERLETFWNKLQEIETDHKRQQITKSPSKPEILPPKKDNIIQVGAPKKVQNIQEQVQPFQISSDDSETESSKEDKIQIVKPQSVLKTVQQNDKMARNLLAELKTKVGERNSTSQPPSRQQSPEKPQKLIPKPVERQKITVVRKTKPFVIEKPPVVESPMKEEKPKPAERPTVQQIYYSKTVKESSSEGESESETESGSESEESESDAPVILKPSTKTISSSKSLRPNTNSTGISTLQNRSITSLENALKTNPDIFVQLKENMKEIVDSRLKDLGIDPEWNKIPNKTYKQNNDIVTHHRNMAAKNVKSFMDIRNNILEQLDNQVKGFKRSDSHDLSTPELEQKPSRFKNLIQNMRNKAKSIIKHERAPTPTTPIYKLTIHKNYSSPSIKQSPEKQTKIKTVKKTEQKAMYESDSDGSETIEHRRNSPVKNKPQPTKKRLRKSRSESSMEVVELSDRDISIPQASSNNNLARSLDSILEMKKELAFQLNKPEDQIQSVSSLDTVDKDEVVIVSPRPRVQNGSGDFHENKLNISSSDLDSDELKEDERIQKSVLKNMATTSATKKKVLFDLHSDKTEITEEQKPTETKTIKKTVVKPNNSLFKTNEWGDSSTSIDSSILEIKKGSKYPTKGQGDTISTKAVINVSTKQNKAQNDISDWDISDIN